MKEKPSAEVRLDKWLWAARFYKTRALAREMVEGGKVHYNGQRSKPSKIVELNATLTLRQGVQSGCPEEIAWAQGWIPDETLAKHATTFAKTDYGKYLQTILAEKGKG